MFSSIRRNGFGVGSARLIVAVIVGGLLLAGCGGAEESPTPAPSTQVEQEPTPTEAKETEVPETVEPEERPVPEEPEAMKTGDKAGAIAAAKFFVEVIEYSMHTSTTDLLEKYSFEDCVVCAQLGSTIDERVKKKVLPINVTYTVKGSSAPEFIGEGAILWTVPLDIVIKEDYPIESQSYTDNVSLVLSVGFDSGKWVLVEVKEL